VFALWTGMVRIFVDKVVAICTRIPAINTNRKRNRLNFPPLKANAEPTRTGTTAALMLKGRIAQNQAFIFTIEGAAILLIVVIFTNQAMRLFTAFQVIFVGLE